VKIIVNADDLGISREVNEAIFDLIAKGHIKSATLIANAPAVSDAARRVGAWPECSFGVHLNLSEFRPLSPEAAHLLTTAAGELSRRNIEQARPTPEMLRAVYEEFGLQIQKLLDLGVPLSHIDSHHHCHTIPQVFPALKAVQKRFGIRRIRASRNIYRKDEAVSRALLMKKRLFNFALRTMYGSRVPDGFTDLPTLLQMDGESARGFESIELMTHPGAPGAEEDTATLRSQWIDALPFAANLCSYTQL
jgi:predicted glycoside hydrolase/deacetylase ChbG (UPF0249 family)